MSYLELLLAFKYPAIFVLTFFEGPVTMTAVGFLYKLGYFNLILAYASLLLGDLVGDVVWYFLGKHGGHRFIRRFGKYLSLDEEKVKGYTQAFRTHEGKIVFLSKITMGFGFAIGVLFAAGMAHVPLKKFILLNILGGFIWTAFLLFLGFSFGNIYTHISEDLKIVSIIAFVILLLLAVKGFSSYMRKRYAQTGIV